MIIFNVIFENDLLKTVVPYSTESTVLRVQYSTVQCNTESIVKHNIA